MAAKSKENKDRIAKVMARAGLCSRREAERWIEAGRVKVNGELLTSPALNVSAADEIIVDGKKLPGKERTRLFIYHKPPGLVTTAHDPQGRPTVFDSLPDGLPRVISVGRLDLNSEGLLLLTNDGTLSRYMELPATGWIRRYRVRAYGTVDEKALAALVKGVTIEGVKYGPIEAEIESTQGANSWFQVSLREGKNREIRRVFEHLGLKVNRLIRTAYGPFQLGSLPAGKVREIEPKIFRNHLPADVIIL